MSIRNSIAMKKRWENMAFRNSVKKHNSIMLKNRWKNPEYRKNRIDILRIQAKVTLNGFKKGNKINSGRVRLKESIKKGVKTRNEKGSYNVKESTKNKIRLKLEGRKVPFSTRKKISSTQQGIKLKDWKKFNSKKEYDLKFNKSLKNIIRNRDNQRCSICDIKRTSLNRELSVHHIDYNKKNCNLNNLISLCANCHGKTKKNRLYWKIFFRDLMNKKYDEIKNGDKK
jgi:hypothetical protein